MSDEPEEHPDLVDVFYRPFVRPLGNLVIAFANAENALRELVAELLEGNELTAADLVSGAKRSQIAVLAESNLFRDFGPEELRETLSQFWIDKDERSRLIHDEWWIGFDPGEGAGVGTRGITRKPAKVVWGEPTIEAIWDLAKRLSNHRLVFAHYARILRDTRTAK